MSPVCAVCPRPTVRGCRCYARPDRTWQAQTAALHVCGRPHADVSRAACCPWRELYWSNQLGDHGAETSPTKWHSEPYGFEIIGRERKKKKKIQNRILTLMPCGLYIWLAVSPSLYPPVWLITWRRVSTWNIEKQQTKQGQSQHKRRTRKKRERGGEGVTRRQERQQEYTAASISSETIRSNRTKSRFRVNNCCFLLAEIKAIYMVTNSLPLTLWRISVTEPVQACTVLIADRHFERNNINGG